MFVRKFTGLAFLCCLSFVFANGLLASSGIKSDSVFDEMHSFYK
jgi:hypothetical protein